MSEVDARALDELKARHLKSPPLPEVSLRNVDENFIGMVHAANALASGDLRFVTGICAQLQHIPSAGAPFAIDRLNFMLSIVKGIAPQDPTETLLASQMATIHCLMMDCAARLQGALTVDQYEGQLGSIVRLTRTFTAQMEALKRSRSNGQQTIRVQHVTVNEGGKAIVGNIQAGGGAAEKICNQPHEPSLGSECGPALLSQIEAVGLALPISGGDGLEGLPLPWGEIGRTKG